MLQFGSDELLNYKLALIKDLEKTLKAGYENQYRSILSKIVMSKKRFVRKKLPINVSEGLYRYNTHVSNLTNYLINLFDVFGESAVLNAKKQFEENGAKWGKKMKRKILLPFDTEGIGSIIKGIYLDIPELDFISQENDQLIWYFSKSQCLQLNREYCNHNTRFYEIKALWLHSFVKSFTPQYISIFEKKNEDENGIVTSIAIKESTA